MTAWVKVAGTWRKHTPRVKVAGAWKTTVGEWVKVAGVWRKVYPMTVGGVVHFGSSHDTNSGSKSVSATPAIGSWLIALVETSHSGGGGIASVTITDSKGGTWTRYGQANSGSGANQRSVGIFLRTTQISQAVATNVIMEPNDTTYNVGGGLTVLEITGAPTLSFVQYGNLQVTASTVPTVVPMPGAVSADNLLVGCVVYTSGTSGTPSGWTNYNTATYATPSANWRAEALAFGGSGSSFTFGGSTTNPAAVVIEFKV
jgi:hypothetical protein